MVFYDLRQGFSQRTQGPQEITGPLPGDHEKNSHFGLQFTFGTKLTKSETVSNW